MEVKLTGSLDAYLKYRALRWLSNTFVVMRNFISSHNQWAVLECVTKPLYQYTFMMLKVIQFFILK